MMMEVIIITTLLGGIQGVLLWRRHNGAFQNFSFFPKP